MRIVLYFINWNDKFYLPFIKDHYGKFCVKIVMYDNHSNDGSQDIARRFGFEVRPFGTPNQLNDQDYLNVKNNCWKEEREKADFVIVCDADEFVVPGILSHSNVGRLNKPTMPVVTGYNMISEELPVKSIFEINTGAPSESYSKQAIFSPRIEEINFIHGCHKNRAAGFIVSGTAKLYHFRQIGGVKRLLDRHAKYRPRLSKFNMNHNMGHHYGKPYWSKEDLESFNQSKIEEWGILKEQSTILYEFNNRPQ